MTGLGGISGLLGISLSAGFGTGSSSPVENLHDLFKEGYSLKEGHHGIGLYEVKNLLKKYPESILNTECREGHFSQTLQIKRPHHPQAG